MSQVIFYEKPGCITNRKQKAILQEVGLTLQVRNLLNYPWQRQELASYFQGLAVHEWFNPSAPDIKTGQLNIYDLNTEEALDLLLNNPLLIRRPLLEIDGNRIAGFSPSKIEAVSNVFFNQLNDEQHTLEGCSQLSSKRSCP